MFTVDDRDRFRDAILEMVRNDPRVVAGAVVGSLAHGPGDAWSDVDLTFGVVDDVPLVAILDDWNSHLTATFDAVHLFDLPHGPSLYRVFMFPGCLQVDLSCTPAAQFGATSPRFRLLFGKAVEKPFPPPPSADELFGYAVHHMLRARFCIARERYWHAEYWISSTRDYALSLACRRRALPAVYGRGFDDLPADVLESFRGTLVTSLTRDELLRALGEVIDGLLREADDPRLKRAGFRGMLRDLRSSCEREEP
ncbi:MAG TPA: hypothetical protein VL282_16460 [Tepidisphaeraceae bacterium]|nr:hypothetical protein [Tepidisphaeraceae bacterium]